MIVRLVQNSENLIEVYRLRYSVYITELSNKVPDADHHQGLLSDNSDRKSAEILGAYYDDKLCGTLRYNPLTEYRRDELPFFQVPEFCWDHPEQTVITSMLVVHPEWRRSKTYISLFREGIRLQLERGRQYCLLYAEPHNAALFAKSGFKYLSQEPMRHPLYRDVLPMILRAGDEIHPILRVDCGKTRKLYGKEL